MLEITQGPDENRLAIFAGRSRFSLAALPSEDFPDLATGDMTHSFQLAAADLKGLIEKTRFAISTEETRYYLNGIYLHSVDTDNGPMLRAVATDGHRLGSGSSELAKPGHRRCRASSCRAKPFRNSPSF